MKSKIISPVEFIDRVIKLNEKGQPWKLSAYQRRVLEMAFRRDSNGALKYRQIVLSEPKKSGKTFLAACCGLWWSTMTPNTEVIVSANDREQSQSRVFKTMADLIEKNPLLQSEAEIFSSTILFFNGTVVTAISSDYRGAAGSRHSLAIYDELWGFESENARRLFEELTPPPTEFSAWTLVVTYAGFSNESNVLQAIYDRGIQGKRIDSDLECYEAGDLFLFWSHTPRQEWQDEKYYESQRKILRPAQFERLHRNQWVSSESSFISPEIYDKCVEPGLRPDSRGSLFVGIDASVRRDSTACIAVRYAEQSDTLELADHRIWRPLPGHPINLEATVEFYLRRLYGQPGTEIVKILYDPFQMIRTAQLLTAAYLPCEELSQTQNHLTEATEALLSAFTYRNLALYDAPDLREHCLNAIAVESARGVRLAKEKQAAKIDAGVALSFAVLAAVQNGRPPPMTDQGEHTRTISKFDPRCDDYGLTEQFDPRR